MLKKATVNDGLNSLQQPLLAEKLGRSTGYQKRRETCIQTTKLWLLAQIQASALYCLVPLLTTPLHSLAVP